MQKFRWGNMDRAEGVYLDENILRMTTNLRLQLSSLAEALIAEGRIEQAREVLDLSIAKMPEHNVPYDRIMLPTIEAYYAIGDTAKADQLAERLFTVMEENMRYMLSLEPRFLDGVMNEMNISHAVMGRLASVAVGQSLGIDPRVVELIGADSLQGASPLARDMHERFLQVDQDFESRMMEVQAGARRNTRMRF